MGRGGLSIERLKAIRKRQEDPGWGSDYEPSIRAVRGEAPSISYAVKLRARKVPGREIHLLSRGEAAAALLGLYHPDVVGLQEQRALMPDDRPHPLHNFPGAIAGGLPKLSGMVHVATRLGYLNTLPRVWVPNPDAPAERMAIIYPYIGDLLWAIRKGKSKLYCLNWSIKDDVSVFKRPVEQLAQPHSQGNPAGVSELLERHELECAYYEEAGIRTVQLGANEIDSHVVHNLRHLFLHHRNETDLPLPEQIEMLERFRRCIETGTPPANLITHLCASGRYSFEVCRDVLFQGIWSRMLRVDLFSPILIDRPFRPEEKDVLAVYADWFRGVSC